MELQAIQKYWDYKPSDRPPGHIGMSGIGMCKRRLAYVHHEIEGIALDWRAKIIFDDGNLHHTQIRTALREGLILSNSCYTLVREEEEVKLGSLTGHIDGILKHDNVACQEDGHYTMLLEVKSMNDRGFQELKRTGELSKDYAAQVSAYLRSLGYDTACVLVKNKNTGEMLRMYFDRDDVLLDERLQALEEVKESAEAEYVKREYHANDDGTLDWHCNYCPFVNLCWRHEGVKQVGPHKFVLNTKIVTPDTNCNTTLSDIKEDSKKNRRKRRKGLAR